MRGVRGGREHVEPQGAGEVPGHEPATHAVAGGVEGRREGRETALAGRDADDPAADATLGRTPTSSSQSPDVSYIPAIAIMASTACAVSGRMRPSPVTGFTPPSARVAPMTARSTAETARQLCRV